MGLRYNPFTGSFDLTRSPGSYIDGEVAAYSDLPLDAAAAPLNSAWLVRASSGLWLLTRKPAGIYIRTATGGTDRDADYTYAGVFPDVFSDANFVVYNDADSTKNLKLDTSGLTTGTTRTLTVPDASGTLPLLETANTFSANQNFSGTNSVAPNQTAASGSSLMTRDLGDARYRQLYNRLLTNQTINNQATLQNIVSVALEVGTYEVNLYYALDGTANTGTRHGFSFDGAAIWRLFRTRASATAYARIAGPFGLGLAEISTTAWIFGIVEVSVAGTLWLQAAQNTSHADNLTVSTYTRVHAERIT
jgi:hypothetical protein